MSFFSRWYEAFVKLVAVWCLKQIDPNKPFGTSLFDALIWVAGGVALEGVVFRQGPGGLEVYMTKRASTETFYPDEWHVPGAFFRRGEKVLDVAKRLVKHEFGVGQPVELYHVEDCRLLTHRGEIESKIYILTLDIYPGELPVDHCRDWFLVNRLPPKTVDVHRDMFIPLAVEAYRKRK